MSIFASTAAVFGHAAQQRALLACVGVSIALHALVLVAFPGFRSSAAAISSKALTARFAAALQEPVPEVRKPAPPRQKPETTPVLTNPDPAAVPQKVEAAPVPEPTTPSAPVEVARAVEPVQPAQSDAIDEAAMRRQYLLGLVQAAKLYMRYPPQARERGWEGRVEVRLVIGASGTIKSAIIKSSSRYPILDDQALDMVKKSQLRLEIPAALRGREFSVDVPVNFELLTG